MSIVTAYILHACQGSWGAFKGPTVSHTGTEKVGQPSPATPVSRLIDTGCPSLTISCSEASAPRQRSSGRCSSFSGGCSTRGPEEFRSQNM